MRSLGLAGTQSSDREGMGAGLKSSMPYLRKKKKKISIKKEIRKEYFFLLNLPSYDNNSW